MEATRQPAAALARRLQGDPDQTGQQNQSCSQEEVEEGWGERGGGGGGGGGGGAGGGAGGGGTGHTVEEVEVFVTGQQVEEKTTTSTTECLISRTFINPPD